MFSRFHEAIKIYHQLKSINDFDSLKELAEQATGKTKDEMAVPAYFSGNFLSRLVFFGRLAWFLQPIDYSTASSILDFGCGTGLLAPYIVEKGINYCGIDLTPETAQRYASKLCLGRTEFHHSLNELAPSQKFDHIISFDVLEHVDDPNNILEQFKLMLTPGGQIALCGPTENLLYHLGRKLVGFTGDYHHRNIDDIFQAAEQMEFITMKHRYWPLPGPAALFKCRYLRL